MPDSTMSVSKAFFAHNDKLSGTIRPARGFPFAKKSPRFRGLFKLNMLKLRAFPKIGGLLKGFYRRAAVTVFTYVGTKSIIVGSFLFPCFLP